MNRNRFYVSRQAPYYQEGHNQVEVAQGGLDYSGSDMLCAEYQKLGEGEEFTGMRKAVDAAIAIARQWKADSGEKVFIATGCTHGMFTELEGVPFTNKVAKQLQQEAVAFDESLPKCDQCGEMLDVSEFVLLDDPDVKFCREYCAEKYAHEQYVLAHEDDVEEEDE